MSNILVTGGLGLIGHNVVNQLSALGHNIIIIDTETGYGSISESELNYLIKERFKKIQNKKNIFNIDICDQSRVKELFAEYKPNYVVHLASFPRQKAVNLNPQLAARVMSEGLVNMLENSLEHNVEKFLYISSSMVYGDFSDNVKEDAVCNPKGQYGILKLAGEHLVRDYTRRHQLQHVILRPSAVYGPLDVSDRVINKFLITAMKNGIINVNGANETLDFTYVDDAVTGIINALLSEKTNNKTYNITKSHSKTLLEAAKLAVSIVGQGQINVKDADPDFPSRGALNIEAARKDFNFDPKIEIEQGFEIYYNWLANSTYWARQIAKQ